MGEYIHRHFPQNTQDRNIMHSLNPLNIRLISWVSFYILFISWSFSYPLSLSKQTFTILYVSRNVLDIRISNRANAFNQT